MKYLSIDLETTHVVPSKGQILQFAAIYEDTDNPLSYKDIPKFEAIIKHDHIYGDPFAIQMNHGIMKIIADVADPAKNVHIANNNAKLYYLVKKWLIEIGVWYTEDKIVVAGKNVSGFDIPWINEHCPELSFRFHRRTLDPGSVFTRPSDKTPPNLTECLKRANLGEPSDLHNATGDAWDIIRLFRAAWKKNE